MLYVIIKRTKIFFFTFLFVFFGFFLREQMTATPTTKKIISAKRTPPISVKIPAPKINEIFKKNKCFYGKTQGDNRDNCINKFTALKF